MLAKNPISELFMSISGGNPGRAVANAHTTIKIAEVILLFPFMTWVVKATYKIIPGEDRKPENDYQLKYISNTATPAVTTAVVDAIQELQHMGELARTNLKESMETLCNPNPKQIEKVYEREKYIDYLNREITDYLVKISTMKIPMADARLVGGLFHVANDIERIGDHAENFADSAKERLEKDIQFSEKAVTQITDMTDMVIRALDYALDMFSKRNTEHMKEVLELEDSVDEKERKIQKSHVKRLSKGKCTPEAGMIYSDTVSGLERAADHATNIAFAILEPENLDDPDEEGE